MFFKNNKNELNKILDNSKDIFDKIIKKKLFYGRSKEISNVRNHKKISLKGR